jgi:hypothetical protein
MQLTQAAQRDHERLLHRVRCRLALAEAAKRLGEQRSPMPIQDGA